MGEDSDVVTYDGYLTVKVMDLENVLYEGSAKSVSSINDKGSFDVLPLHSNFITLIQKKILIEDASGVKQTFEISNGVLICKQNQVRIYLGL